MNYLADAASFLGLVFCLVAFGWSVSSREKSSFESAFLPGAALLGLYAFLIWVYGALWRLDGVVFLILGGGMVPILWQIKKVAFHARRFWSARRQLSLGSALLSLYLLGLFAFTFFLCLAPLNGADYDSLTYHLAAPAQFLRFGKIVELPYDHHSYFPFTLEMLYTAGLWARGPVFAKLFHWLMLPLGSCALLALGKRAHSLRAGLVAACLYASMPLVLQEATTAYVDLGFAAFAFLALLCFWGAPTTEKGQNWLWCGAFCGFCLGTKYFGWLVFGFLGGWLLISMLRTRQFSLRHLAYFALPALFLGAPWYIRNAIWTGNPVYPFAFGLFGGRGWTAQMAHDYDVSQALFGFGKAPLDLILLPWRLAMSPLNIDGFNGKMLGQPYWPLLHAPVTNGQYGFFDVPVLDVVFTIFPGPAIMVLGWLSLLGKNKPRAIGMVAWFFGFLWVFWAISSQQVRYLLPAFGLLALLGGWGVAQYGPRLRFARLVGMIGLGFWLLLSPALIAWRARGNFVVLSGAVSSQDYLHHAFPGYNAMQRAAQETPPSAKFAVYGEPRCFYLDRNYFWADDAHNNLVDYAHIQTGADLWRALKSLGATHVLWNSDAARNGGVFGPPSQIEPAIEQGYLIFLFDERGYRVYALK